MDINTAAAICGTAVSIAALIWGIVSCGFKQSSDEKLSANDRLEAIEQWRVSITEDIERLRQDINHVREISDIKDAAANERLTRMEQKLDELLDLLISLVRDRD